LTEQFEHDIDRAKTQSLKSKDKGKTICDFVSSYLQPFLSFLFHGFEHDAYDENLHDNESQQRNRSVITLGLDAQEYLWAQLLPFPNDSQNPQLLLLRRVSCILRQKTAAVGRQLK
jgi:hypothetical protein